MPISAVIFDLFDVLLLHEQRHVRHAFERERGLAENTLEQTMLHSPLFRDALAGRVSEQQLWEDVATRLQLASAEWRTVAAVFYRGLTLNQELVATMRTLRPAYKLGILSNAPSSVRTLVTQEFQLDQVVDLIIISAEELLHKPQPEIYQLAARRLDVPVEACLFIDDRMPFVVAARQVGMQAIQFQHNEQAIADLQTLLL
ncbi:hydrolase [Dictyobacter vulcani]|uniref:Hydrolase n=1 Tax=Dictyobacter vulcani TaxID=2607529 RepID=A0A5J4KWC6_9CHLR|nr:HAD family phosphatase [Dictyobacter vulcani]GER92275.1 hydrolase [Dictyobacter vulcani]